MENHIIHVITRCTRPDNLPEVWDSVSDIDLPGVNIRWHVLFDTSRIDHVDADILSGLYRENVVIRFIEGETGDYGHGLINVVLDEIPGGWVYVLDDDNTICPDMLKEFTVLYDSDPDKRAVVFSQKVGGVDFSGLDVRVASPENMKVGHVDMAQFIIRRDLIADNRFVKGSYVADGLFITSIYENNPSDFIFSEKVVTHYNSLKRKVDMSPRILSIGMKTPCTGGSMGTHESGKLNVINVSDECDINGYLKDFDPHAILTTGDWKQHINLSSAPYYIRRRWLNVTQDDRVGDVAYGCAMNTTLDRGHLKKSVSYFTPMYNTGDRLLRTYRTLRSQTVPDWEWVLIDDSDDGGYTIKLAKELARQDYRVRVYDIRPSTGGVVGEAKHRAVSMCRFGILAELDHDDLLLPDCTEVLIRAVSENPDAGFFYSDYALLGDDMSPKDYGPTFTFGYGSYYDTDVFGGNMKVVRSNNINPKTIRHIVGIPNHIRVWTKEGYMGSGGYNRMLSVADDHDLFIRTFLKCGLVRIEKCLYAQILRSDGGNTHVLTRGDIQRRVRTITSYYEQDIRNRFKELGIEDWASKECPTNPLSAVSRFGQEESYVNHIWLP